MRKQGVCNYTGEHQELESTSMDETPTVTANMMTDDSVKIAGK